MMKRLFKWLFLANLALSGSAAAADMLSADTSAKDKTTAEPAQTTDSTTGQTISIDTSFDVNSRYNIGGYGGVTYAPGGVDKSGVRVKIDGANGGFNYNDQGNIQDGQPPLVDIHGHYVNVSTFIGYTYINETLYASLLIGPNYQHVSVSKYDPSNSTIGARWGVITSLSADYKPMKSVSLAVAGFYSTANSSWWSRFRPGYEIAHDVYLGPEAGLAGNSFWRQWTLGGHLRGIKVGAIELGVGTGFLRDSKLSNGWYGTLEASYKF